MAGSPAQAAGETDLSITKTVATAAPPVTYIPELSDVRNGGTATFGRSGIAIRSTGTTDKVANYWAQSGPIPTSASMSWTQDEGIFMPGMQIIFDADGTLGNNVDDWNILVNVPSDNGSNWWLTPSSSTTAKALAPSCNNPGPACVGLVNGYPWYGSLGDWAAALGPNAKVYAVGYSLGSGASGINSGVLASMTYGSHTYDFVRHYTPTLQAEPGDTVEYQLTVANGAAGADATGVTVNDVLPADLTYVPGSLEYSGPSWCSVTGQALSCTGGTLPAGSSADVWFRATISDDVSSAGLGSTIGHNVDVQKQEVFADITAGQTRSFTVACPAGYVATDGGLLVDAVDQGGYYSDIVVAKSVPTPGGDGWLVKVSNLGDQRGQGKVKVTCLDGTIGSANGHTHDVVVTASNGAASILASSTDDDGEPVTVTCPAGYTPVAPQHTVTSGIAVIRSSYASGSSWTWMVDHEAGTAATFDVRCLSPETTSSNGHTATLPLTTSSYTISVDPESRTDEVVQCGPSKHGIVGGYDGEDAGLLSLGKEQRGNNYMFRFWNDDWASDWSADLSVTCVGVRTADEPVYYHVRNTATISSPAADLSTADNSSTADISIIGDSTQPAGGVVVNPTASRTGSPGNIKKLTLGVTCTSACAFTVKVVKDGTVVAKATKSLAASPDPRFVVVPTTSAGKDLMSGDVVTVKIKTSTGTTSTTVTLL